MDNALLKQAIDQVVYENTEREISATSVNSLLKQIVDVLGYGYQFVGIATPSTEPTLGDQRIFYLAGEAGTYANFDNIVVGENEFAILKYDTAWGKESIGKGLSTNDFTDADKAKLDDLEDLKPLIYAGL